MYLVQVSANPAPAKHEHSQPRFWSTSSVMRRMRQFFWWSAMHANSIRKVAFAFLLDIFSTHTHDQANRGFHSPLFGRSTQHLVNAGVIWCTYSLRDQDRETPTPHMHSFCALFWPDARSKPSACPIFGIIGRMLMAEWSVHSYHWGNV